MVDREQEGGREQKSNSSYSISRVGTNSNTNTNINNAHTEHAVCINASIRERDRMYTNISINQQHLDLAGILRYFETHPPTPGYFFPSSMTMISRSLSLTHARFMVGPSTLVPGQLGLLAKVTIPARNGRQFIGVYTGWLQKNEVPVAQDSVPPGLYSLSLGSGDMRICGHDKDSGMGPRMFPLGYINEYIWNPDMNTATFDRNGLVFLRKGAQIRKGTEITIGLGMQQYCWEIYQNSLQERVITTVVQLLRRQGKIEWIPYLTSQYASKAMGRTSVFHDYLEQAVLCYMEHDHTVGLGLTPGTTLGEYCRQILWNKTFSLHHVFRKADHPKRPYTAQLFDTIELAAEVTHARRDTRLRQQERKRYGEQDDADIVTTLLVSPSAVLRECLTLVPPDELLHEIRSFQINALLPAHLRVLRPLEGETQGEAIVHGQAWGSTPTQDTDPTLRSQSQHTSGRRLVKGVEPSPYPHMFGTKSWDETLRRGVQSVEPISLCPQPDTIKVGFFNVRGLKYKELERLVQGVLRQHIDILCCTDTQIHLDTDIRAYKQVCKDWLGAGSSVHFAKATEVWMGNRSVAIGGQMVLKSSRLNKHLKFHVDPRSCGSLVTLNIPVGSTELQVISVYVPVVHAPGTHPASLWEKIHNVLIDTGDARTPEEFLLQSISTKVDKHHKATNTATIVGGDFNAAWDERDPHQGTNRFISGWATIAMLRRMVDPVQGSSPCRTIDHLMYRGSALIPLEVQELRSDEFLISDHAPLVGAFRVPTLSQRYEPRRGRKRRTVTNAVDIPRESICRTPADHKRLEKYQRLLTEKVELPALEVDNSERFMDELAKCAVATARRLQPGQRTPSGWSPECVALTIARIQLREMKRRWQGTAGRRQWSSHTVTAGIKSITDNWYQQLNAFAKDRAQLRALLRLTNRPPHFWTSIPVGNILSSIDSELVIIGKLLHARNRLELRQRLADKTENRKLLRKQGRHLTEVKQLLNRVKPYWQMDELVDDSQCIQTDPRTILRIANSHFYAWHAKQMHVTTGLHDSNCDQHRLLNDYAYFVTQHISTSIPEPLLRVIWQSLQPTRVQQCERLPFFAQERQALLDTPSWEEFTEMVNKSARRSAPGPSGLTYNMIASLPLEILRALYDHLVLMWSNKRTCVSWKWRMLSPLPKVSEDITINDIRPLTLIETTRKLWTSIFINRIKRFWATYALIHPTQHAYTRKTGVETVHPQVRNALEEARETCTSVYYSSWDIRRAFDRVPKSILRMAWERSGIPAELAEYLVEMDVNGDTLIATPYSRKILRTQGLAGFARNDATKCPSFQAEVGTGQGDVSSPFVWNCFYDILLTALDGLSDTAFLTRGSCMHLQPTLATGYADDLLTISPTLEALQIRADVVSAFSILCGMEIAPSKLRAVQIHWGKENMTLSDERPLLVRVHTWLNEVQVPILAWDDPRAKVVKYLGILLEYDNSGDAQYQQMILEVKQQLYTLLRRAAPAQIKLEAITCSVYPQVRFVGKFSSWTLKQLYELDKLFCKAYRRILRLPNFPTSLIYGTAALCGVGLHRLSDLINKDKYALMQRAMQGSSGTKHAMNGLLHRALRACGQETTEGVRGTITHACSTMNLWANSLVEWLALGDLRLTRGGRLANGAQYHSLMAMGLPNVVEDKLRQLGLMHVQDISVVRDGMAEYQHLDKIHDGWTMPAYTGDAESTEVWPFQGWIHRNERTVTEILGWNQTKEAYVVREWVPKTQRDGVVEGATVVLAGTSASRGAGTSIVRTHEQLFGVGETLYRVILSGDRYRLGGLINRQVLSMKESDAPTVRAQVHARYPGNIDLDGQRERLLGMDIYTDAGYKEHGDPVRCYFGMPNYKTGNAAVVLHYKHKRVIQAETCVIRITDVHKLPKYNAYILEALGLLLGATIRTAIRHEHPYGLQLIHTDCQSLEKQIQKPDCTAVTYPGHYLLNKIKRLASKDIVRWVRSHPERRLHREKWTANDIGNDIANTFAAEVVPSHGNIHEITVTDMLDHYMSTDDWTVTSEGLPYLGHIHEKIQESRFRQYLQHRDDERVRWGKPRKWVSMNLQHTGTWHDSRRSTYMERVRISKTVFDWAYHGTRAVLHLRQRYPQPLDCPLCLGPNDSQYHMYCECTHPDIQKQRMKLFTELDRYIRLHHASTPEHKIATAFRELADPADLHQPHLVWTGTWTQQHIDRLASRLPKTINTKRLHTTMTEVGTIFAHHVLRFGEVRGIVLAQQRKARRTVRTQQPSRYDRVDRGEHSPRPTRLQKRCDELLQQLLKPAGKKRGEKNTKGQRNGALKTNMSGGIQSTVTDMHQSKTHGLRVHINADVYRRLTLLQKRKDTNSRVQSPYANITYLVKELQDVLDVRRNPMLSDGVLNGFIEFCNAQSSEHHCYRIDYMERLEYQDVFLPKSINDDVVTPWRYRQVLIPKLLGSSTWVLFALNNDTQHVDYYHNLPVGPYKPLRQLKSWLKFQANLHGQGSVDLWTMNEHAATQMQGHAYLNLCLTMANTLFAEVTTGTDAGMFRRQLVNSLISRQKVSIKTLDGGSDKPKDTLARVQEMDTHEYLTIEQYEGRHKSDIYIYEYDTNTQDTYTFSHTPIDILMHTPVYNIAPHLQQQKNDTYPP